MRQHLLAPRRAEDVRRRTDRQRRHNGVIEATNRDREVTGALDMFPFRLRPPLGASSQSSSLPPSISQSGCVTRAPPCLPKQKTSCTAHCIHPLMRPSHLKRLLRPHQGRPALRSGHAAVREEPQRPRRLDIDLVPLRPPARRVVSPSREPAGGLAGLTRDRTQ